MSMSNLEEAFVNELKDLLGAEKQIVKALKTMARKADNAKLKQAFEEHERQTEEHVSRLEQVFELLDQKPRGKKCEAIEGILAEGKEVMEDAEEDQVRDALMIAAAQKVEHYEIASYGTICTWGEQLHCNADALNLLKKTLSEEKETDKLLTQIAESTVNESAVA